MAFYDKSLEALGKGAAIEKIVAMSSRERIGRFKYADEKQSAILNPCDRRIVFYMLSERNYKTFDKAVKAKDED